MNNSVTFALFSHLLIMLALLACGTFLVYTNHYGWAWIPFLGALCQNLKIKDDGKDI